MLVMLLGIIVFEQPIINVLFSVSIIALQLSRESYFGFPRSTFIDVRLEQLEKAIDPIRSILLGIMTEDSLVQPENA